MKIVVGDPNLVPHRDRLEAALPPGSVVHWHDVTSPGRLDDLRDADVFVGGRFTAEMAGAAEKLRLVHAAGAGTDKIAFDALAPGVLVANTFHHEQSIAEYVLAAVLLRRGFLEQDGALREGIWARRCTTDRSRRQGRCKARGWDSLASDTSAAAAGSCSGRSVAPVRPSRRSGRVDAAVQGLAWTADVGHLDRLMTESEVVVVSAPLTERTAGMIGEKELHALGPRGVLINVGRGPLVVESALYEALSARTIAAAAIDVWYRYPDADGNAAPSELPFDKLQNVLMTPHSSGVTENTFVGRVDDIAANIGRMARGEPLQNLVSGPDPRH